MNFTDLITSHGKRVTKEAFRYLVQVSRVDGIEKNTEEETLFVKFKKKLLH